MRTVPAAMPRLTFREWVEARVMRDKTYETTPLGPDIVAFLREARLYLSERTLDQYERDLRLVALAVGCDASGVSHLDLMLVLEVLPEASRNRARSAWAEFFRWAIREGKRPDNPEQRLPKRRKTPTPVYDELFEPNEHERLFAAAGRMRDSLTERLRVLTLIETGARAAELRGVRLADFDLYGKQVRVTGKGGKTRLIPISVRLSSLVDERLLTPYLPPVNREPVETDYLWFATHKMGERVLTETPHQMLGYGGFRRWWLRVENEADVRHRRAHMHRHTLATDILDATGNVYAVQEVLGHANLRTSETYMHSSRRGAGRKQAAMQAVQEWRAQGGSDTE